MPEILFARVVKGGEIGELRRDPTWILSAEFAKASAAELQQIGDSDQRVRSEIAKLTSPWMLRFIQYDPRPARRKVRCPRLAINGDLDLQVYADQNLTEIGKVLTAAKHPDHEIVRLKGLNHLLQTARTGSPAEYSKIEETCAPAALKVVGDFISRRFLER